MKTYHLRKRDGEWVDTITTGSYKDARSHFELKYSGEYRIEWECEKRNVKFK
jgi:hypothetical protein